MLEFEPQEKLISDIKKKIKKDVLDTCKENGIDEVNVIYDLKLQLNFPIHDEIKRS